ncbi:MAG: Helix-turn-helix domain, partial [Pseudomonadota bacterium]
MTDSNPSSPVPAAEGTEPAAVRESKVSRLRAAREQKGVHLGVLASSLKVPVARLQALEEGRFEEFADPVFV